MSNLGKNVQVAFRKEAVFGTAPGTGSGTILRPNPSPGLDLKKALIKPGEFRKDGQSAMARQGTLQVAGSFEADLIVGSLDVLIDGLMRSAVTALVTATSADFTNITITGTNTITWNTGDPRTKFKTGDVFKISGSANSANHNKWFRISSQTATTMVTAGTALSNQAADAGATLTRTKKWINGATPTRASYYFEQLYQDLAKGDQFMGVRVIGGKISLAGDAMVKVTFNLLGQNGLTNQVAYYVTPTLPTGTGLVSEDATIRLNGVDYSDITGLEINFGMGGAVPSMVGTNLPPDVFENNLEVTGSVSFLMSDTVRQLLWVGANDTEWELQVLLQTPTGTPTDMVWLFLPRCKFTDMSDPLGTDQGIILTAPFTCGVKDVTTGYDSATIAIGTSAA